MIELTIIQLVLVFTIIVVIGILANIAGFGGAIFIVPLLSVGFHLPLKIVIGSSLSAIAIPAMIGFIASWRRSEVDFTAGIYLEIPTIMGAVVGASLVNVVNEIFIQLIFGCIALIVSLTMLRRTFNSRRINENPKPSKFWERLTTIKPWFYVNKEEYSYRISVPFMAVAGFIIGLLSGLLGVGGGWLKTPLLIIGVGLPPIIASGTALFMLILTSISGGLVHFFSGNWDGQLFLVIAIGLSLGAVVGDYIKQRIEQYFISLLISLTLFIVSIIILLEAFFAI